MAGSEILEKTKEYLNNLGQKLKQNNPNSTSRVIQGFDGFTNIEKARVFWEIYSTVENPVTKPGAKDTTWSDDDLKFIIDHYEDFEKIKNLNGGGDNDDLIYNLQKDNGSISKFQRDFWYTQVKGTFFNGDPWGIQPIAKDEKKPSKLLVQAAFYALRLYLPGQLKETFPIAFFTENESAILETAALQEYSFKNFDIKIAQEFNKYLDQNPEIPGLDYAEADGDYYIWTKEKANYSSKEDQIKIHKTPAENLVDNALFLRAGSSGGTIHNTSKYKKPLQSSSSKTENKVRLNESEGFNKFEISGQKIANASSSYLSPGIAWIRALIKILDYKKNSKDSSGRHQFDPEKADKTFVTYAQAYLKTDIRVSDIQGISGDRALSVRGNTARIILNRLKFVAWLEYATMLKDVTKEGDPGWDDTQKNILEALEKAFAKGEEAASDLDSTLGQNPNAPRPDVPSEEEIEARQKFLKQCALMTRLDELGKEHVALGRKRYKERFYMMKDGNKDQQGLVSKLLLPQEESIKEFLEIDPAAHSYLIPKLRFFKVLETQSGLTEEEFKFRNFTSETRISNLISIDYDKGGDFGIKEFSFSFEGTTPATAKNDIKANLSLFFQTFDDFIITQPENKSPFVDMLLMPGSGKKKGSGKESAFQFQPDYYRIRVDAGWMVPDENLKNIIGEERYISLKDGIQKTNKSFYLNMVDHTIDFRDDGSVQIDVEYRAYAESALKGTALDALSSNQSRKSLNQARQDYIDILATNKCNAKELGKIKRQLAQIEDLLKKQAYQSIMNRLIKNNMLFFKKLKISPDNNFQKYGFFSARADFASSAAAPSTSTNLTQATQGKTVEIGDNFFNEKLSNDEDYLFVNYFYLGDLLYIIMDSLYKDDGKTYVDGCEKFKFILGSFQYEDIFDNETQFKSINIASIPVSAELFFEWYTDNVVKTERKSYPIMFFIRDLLKYLVGEILSENCFKRSLDKKLQFNTTNFIGIGDPLSDMNGTIIDADAEYKASKLPVIQDDGKEHDITEYTNYILIYVDTPKLSINGKEGIKDDDGKQGIYHFQIGKPKGIVKKIKFGKTDMQYIREARFFRNGFDGLMQLANVYNVTLSMIGNTIYYPGMELYINPLGYMGAKDNNYDPTNNQSVANRLGFGGYHLVTSVKSTIGPGKFTTEVTAMFNYSGDGDPASKVIGSSEEVKAGESLSEKVDENNRPAGNKEYCSAAYKTIVNLAFDINDGTIDTYPGIDAKDTSQTTQAQSPAPSTTTTP